MLPGSCPRILQYCSAVWCSAVNTHLKQLNRVVSGASFLTGGVFECDIAHRRSVEVLWMLYKIGCNPMHPHYGTVPVPYVPEWVTRSALEVHRHTSSLQNLAVPQDFISLPVSLWNDLGDHIFEDAWLAGLKSRANEFLWSLPDFYCFPNMFFDFMSWNCVAMVFGLVRC